MGLSSFNLQKIIALEQILYKKPQLLILDEATSAMDRNTEQCTLQLLKIPYQSNRIGTSISEFSFIEFLNGAF